MKCLNLLDKVHYRLPVPVNRHRQAQLSIAPTKLWTCRLICYWGIMDDGLCCISCCRKPNYKCILRCKNQFIDFAESILQKYFLKVFSKYYFILYLENTFVKYIILLFSKYFFALFYFLFQNTFKKYFVHH
jgi:hypothetical protein